MPNGDSASAMLGIGRIALESVKVTQNGKVVTLPAIEAIHRRWINDALKRHIPPRGGSRSKPIDDEERHDGKLSDTWRKGFNEVNRASFFIAIYEKCQLRIIEGAVLLLLS